MSLSKKSSELYFFVAVFPTHGVEEQLAAQQPGNWTRTSSIDIIIVMAEPWSNLTESENDKWQYTPTLIINGGRMMISSVNIRRDELYVLCACRMYV